MDRRSRATTATAGWSVVGRLRKAVKKINLILFSLNVVTRWQLMSSTSMRRRKLRPRREQRRFLSFNERLVGLQAYTELDDDDDDDDGGGGGEYGGERGQRAVVLDRTCSLTAAEQEDVDKRSERFIANFRRDLLLERQVSLELGYCKVERFG